VLTLVYFKVTYRMPEVGGWFFAAYKSRQAAVARMAAILDAGGQAYLSEVGETVLEAVGVDVIEIAAEYDHTTTKTG